MSNKVPCPGITCRCGSTVSVKRNNSTTLPYFAECDDENCARAAGGKSISDAINKFTRDIEESERDRLADEHNRRMEAAEARRDDQMSGLEDEQHVGGSR